MNTDSFLKFNLIFVPLISFAKQKVDIYLSAIYNDKMSPFTNLELFTFLHFDV